MNDRVKLNVGGTKFRTTRGTLTSSPHSLLAKMFDPDSDIPPAAVSEDGHYFLDACPRAFSVILNWLRYKDVILGKEVDARDVIPVADYFGLPELCEKLGTMKKPEVTQNNNNVDIIRLNVGGTIFETSRATLLAEAPPYSKLAKMFKPGSETSPPLTEDGAYFIDACPKAAEFVLNSLRRQVWGSFNIDPPRLPAGIDFEDLDVAANNFMLNSRRARSSSLIKETNPQIIFTYK